MGVTSPSTEKASASCMLDDMSTCPLKNLLWFHNVPWDHQIVGPDGEATTLFQMINRTHFGAVEDAAKMGVESGSLKGVIDDHRFRGVQARFAQQANDAAAMSIAIMGQYTRWAFPLN